MKLSPTRFLPALALSALLSAPVYATTEGQVTDAVAPELATGSVMRKSVKGKEWMVASANPLASKAGEAMLRAGGNAIDAMVAVQTVLGWWNHKAPALVAALSWCIGTARHKP